MLASARMQPLTWDRVLAWRMGRQFLDKPSTGGAVEVLRRLSGVQAQVARAAELAVGVRLPAAGRQEVARALGERRVVKTWAMRGTLHLLPADVASAYLTLIAAARTWETPSWQKAFLSSAQVARLSEAVREALRDGPLSREELTQEVLRRTRDKTMAEHLRSGWGMVLKPLAWQGILCHGPAAGSRVTFTSPEAWSPDWRPPPSEEEAARIVVPAYLGGYGPATVEAFGAWLLRGAAGRRALRSWFAAAGDLLAKVDVDGTEAFARVEDVDEIGATRPGPSVRLLPAFDQYVLGPGTADVHVLRAERRSDVSRAAGWIAPVVIAAGRIAGTWETRESNLEVTLFAEEERPPTAALEAEAKRIGSLFGQELELKLISSPHPGEGWVRDSGSNG